MDLNLSPGAVFHAEFVSGSQIVLKPTQNPILTNFCKNQFFYRAAASAGGLFNTFSNISYG